VADNNNARIQKWPYGSTSGTTIAGTMVSGSSATQLSSPRAVVAYGNTIYVADSGNYRIQAFLNGSTTGVTVVSSRLGTVMSMEIDSSGNIYMSDMGNNTIWKNQTAFASGKTSTYFRITIAQSFTFWGENEG
jgi:sugar lactone lactonase YvrE